MSTKLTAGNQVGIPSLYSLVSFKIFLSWSKNRFVLRNLCFIFLVAFLNCSVLGFFGRFTDSSLVSWAMSGRLWCRLLCSTDRASAGIRHMVITTTTDIATNSFLGKPGTNIIRLNYFRKVKINFSHKICLYYSIFF